MGDGRADTGEHRSPSHTVGARTVQGAAIAGIIAGIGWMVALAGVVELPAIDASDAEISAHYLQLDGSAGTLVRLQLLTFATFGFFWFIGVIRDRIGLHEPKLFGTVFLGSGIMLACLLFVGYAVAITPTLLVVEADRVVDPDAAATTRMAARILLGVIAPRVASLFIFSMSTLALRTQALPMWLIVISYLTGLANLVNVTFWSANTLVFPGWMIVVSAYLLIAGRRVEEAAHLPGTGDGGAEAAVSR